MAQFRNNNDIINGVVPRSKRIPSRATIVNRMGERTGMIRSRMLFDANGSYLGDISQSRQYGTVYSMNGVARGQIDASGNLITFGNQYEGTIKTGARLTFAAALIIMLAVILTSITTVLAVYIIQSRPNFDLPTFEFKVGESLVQDRDFDIFPLDASGRAAIHPRAAGVVPFTLVNANIFALDYAVFFSAEGFDNALVYIVHIDGTEYGGGVYRDLSYVNELTRRLPAAQKTSHKIELYWRWNPAFSDEVDTVAGNSNLSYTLNVIVSAMQQ